MAQQPSRLADDPLREPTDQTSLCWRDDAFLSTYPLDRRTVLDYFAGSPFYDKGCNNEIARSRGLGVESLPLMPAGPEYVLVDSQEPHLFVIRRQRRGAPGAAPVPQATYYVLDGGVYQAPSVAAVLSARLERCLFSARRAFERMQRDLDPLVAAERELERATRVAAKAAASANANAAAAAAKANEEEENQREGKKTAPPPPPPLIPPSLLAAPPRRLTEVERERLRRGERIVATVLSSQFPMPSRPKVGAKVGEATAA